ncbi:MAG: hypothetical protein JO154_21930 [Chitinophaga sp.]|uniref:hypothetical protein n=1 Tax=Chitinophaga sp. TaxID=1869181 RepID=UPI0025C72231|nr:hypothetical protein [Chitinophaga sp.]MBV8255275.1 hypothetical protein [Chitinophaga sp.]
MNKLQGRHLIGLVAWATVVSSAVALIYFTRWLIPLLSGQHSYVAPSTGIPVLWFVVKIASYSIFMTVGILLLRLYRKHKRAGYFAEDSIRVFDKVIISCLILALLGFIQTFFNNIDALHTDEWTSVWAITNRLLQFSMHFFVLNEPQTMYLLLAAILWIVRQFVVRAIVVKNENESFI